MGGSILIQWQRIRSKRVTDATATTISKQFALCAVGEWNEFQVYALSSS